jgi:hypothetical protein
MKIVGITSTALLSLLLGVAVPAYAQHEEQSEKQDHPELQQGKHEQGKPEKQQHGQAPQHAQREQRPEQNQQAHQSQQQDRNMEKQHARQQQRTEQSNRQQQDRNNQQQHAQRQQRERDKQQLDDQQQQAQQQQRNNPRPPRSQEQQRIQQSAWREHRSRHWDSDHRTWRQRGGYRGYRVPAERFRGYLGPSHRFRIYGLPFLVVGGYPRFQYEGYWFSPVDPWPEYWGNDWYDNDDVYVNYVDNGYYLYNSRYPSVAIAISISM